MLNFEEAWPQQSVEYDPTLTENCRRRCSNWLVNICPTRIPRPRKFCRVQICVRPIVFWLQQNTKYREESKRDEERRGHLFCWHFSLQGCVFQTTVTANGGHLSRTLPSGRRLEDPDAIFMHQAQLRNRRLSRRHPVQSLSFVCNLFFAETAPCLARGMGKMKPGSMYSNRDMVGTAFTLASK